MNKPKKELIIESIQKMDLDMLGVLLDDDKTYQDASKPMFLKKIQEAFDTFKNHGDTFLSANKGFCNSKYCTNAGCKGYSFLGNKSKNYINLIFDEIDNEINDIYQCNSFYTEDSSEQGNTMLDIDIKLDERAGFMPSVDFLINSHECEIAYEELMLHSDKVIDKEVYLIWLEKHRSFYLSLDDKLNYKSFYKFYCLYDRINELQNFLQTNTIALDAIKEFQSLDKPNDTQLLNWLVKYEQTGLSLSLFLFEELDIEKPETCTYFTVNDLKINTSDFIYIAHFKFLFDKHYYDMFSKYKINSYEEINQILMENNELKNNINNLSYHLEKRGIKY